MLRGFLLSNMDFLILSKLILILLYGLLPPLSLWYIHTLIYIRKHPYARHIHYIARYLITLSVIPLLYIGDVNLGLRPEHGYSVVLFVLTIALAFLGIPRAIKFKNLYFYNSGITAAFMEEFLFRGAIFGLALSLWNDEWIALGVSSFLFGVWHLKNNCPFGWKAAIIQFLYTGLFYGPLFALARILTGDLYLAILLHYLVDATCALAPDWMRRWLVHGGRGGYYDDPAKV